MEGIRDLLKRFTEEFPPPSGERHYITLSDGFKEVSHRADVNVVFNLTTDCGPIYVFLTDDDLRENHDELFETIVELLRNDDLIE